MRRRERRLPGVPDPALVREPAPRRGVHRDEPRERPRLRLRRERAPADDLGARHRRAPAHGSPGPGDDPARRADPRRARRVLLLSVDGVRDRRRAGKAARSPGVAPGGRRDRVDARRRRGGRPPARQPRHGALPRREPRRRRPVRPRRRRRGRRPRRRPRTARVARDGVVPGSPDRLLAREPRRVRGAPARGPTLDRARSCG